MNSKYWKQCHNLPTDHKVLILICFNRRGGLDRAKVAKADRRKFTSSGVDVIWQSSILVNKWWGQGTETETRSKTLINYLYLHNETTLILVSRSGRKQDDLFCAFNTVGISLITRGMENWFSLHRKPIVHLDHLSQPWPRRWWESGAGWQCPWKLHVSQRALRRR